MPHWGYDYPTWALGVAFLVTFLASSSAGIFLVRRSVHSWIHRPGRSRENEMVGLALANCFLLLGLLLGLVAVGTYQNYTSLSDTVDKEASALAVFAGDATAYPMPHRTMLLGGVGGYIKATVEQDWPQMQHGQLPLAGTKALLGISRVLLSFEPVTENQKILQARLFQHLNDIIEMRRSRISMMELGLPAVLWWVVWFGVLINLCLIWVQDMEVHVHYLLGALLSLSLGSVIFVTAVLQDPFAGQAGVGPEPIRNVGNLMQAMIKDACASDAKLPPMAAQLFGGGGCADRISRAMSGLSQSEDDHR